MNLPRWSFLRAAARTGGRPIVLEHPGVCDALHAPEGPSRFASAARRRYPVLGPLSGAALSSAVRATGAVAADYPSGQRELTVDQLALPKGVRIPHLPRRRAHVTRSTGNAPRIASGQGDG